MPIQVTCPSCQRQLRVPDNLIGQRVKCPSCANTFTAEQDGGEERASARTADEETGMSARRRTSEVTEDRPPRRRDEDDEDRLSRRRAKADRGDYAPHRAPLILTLGIISVSLGGLEVLSFALVFCCGPFGIVALLCSVTAIGLGIPSWIMGAGDLAKIRKGQIDPDGESGTKGGWICGIIGTILGGLGLVCGVILIIIALLWFGAMWGASQ